MIFRFQRDLRARVCMCKVLLEYDKYIYVYSSTTRYCISGSLGV